MSDRCNTCSHAVECHGFYGCYHTGCWCRYTGTFAQDEILSMCPACRKGA
jgi:hypothetical protein